MFEKQDLPTLEQKEELKQQVFPNVPEKFTNGFPEGYRPWIDGWSFQIEKLREKLPDGTYKLLTLDVSISRDEYVKKVNAFPKKDRSKAAEELYDCKTKCAHCFECKTDTDNLLMPFEEVKTIVEKAKDLGLETVKFLGPGELLLNEKLFDILDYFEKENIKISIFTKGWMLADDKVIRQTFGLSSDEFCKKLVEFKCARLLIGFVSADPKTEHERLKTSVEDFSGKRNKGIEKMASLGMNADLECQRLAMICAPVLKDNIDEAFEIYKWGVRRNIPVVLAPTMVSGKGLDMPEIQDEEFKTRDLVELYSQIYSWLIKEKIMTLEQLEEENVSPYAGYACNQVISGMFIRKDGRVQACPGNETKQFRYSEDIRTDDLETVWKNSMGYGIRKELVESGKITLTQPCYAKTEGKLIPKGSITEDFGKKVIARVAEKLSTKY